MNTIYRLTFDMDVARTKTNVVASECLKSRKKIQMRVN